MMSRSEGRYSTVVCRMQKKSKSCIYVGMLSNSLKGESLSTLPLPLRGDNPHGVQAAIADVNRKAQLDHRITIRTINLLLIQLVNRFYN